ncbi:hypothetical protein C8A03DRAFT_14376 [Achaetomium macrosporum]|uniref:EDC4-like protein pdc1 beta-propeller domain-containing protein n=1 Tax=Achaetomium macrosporum TaxID=79813 RepID=A0AAN7HBZ7_9PEZI|nr:hypothetical protein C8A03DRAFT_14376 [Achaetomium macrosporum]
MSNYGLPGGSGPADQEATNPKFESLLAQLRLQSSPSPGPGATSGSDFHGQFNYNHGGQQFYGHHSNPDSPHIPSHAQNAADSPAFLPEAPTPPVGFSQSQFPPGFMNQIGGLRGGGGGGTGDDRTAHLLNLLKYSGQSGASTTQQSSTREPPMNFAAAPAPIAPPVIHAPAPAAADPTGLLAALMKGNLQPEPAKPESTWNQASPPSDTQQYLLNLLNRPKPSQHDADEFTESNLLTPAPAEDDTKDAESPHGRRSVEATLVDTLASRSEFDFEHKNAGSPPPKFDSTPHSQHSHQSSSRQGAFGYPEHFEGVAGSSPIHRTPKSSTTPGASSSTIGAGQPAPVPVQILKKPDSVHVSHDKKRPVSDRGAIDDSPDHTRRKLEHTASPLSQFSVAAPTRTSASPTAGASPNLAPVTGRLLNHDKKESVADAVGELAEQADREAREALARAEQEQAQVEPVSEQITSAGKHGEPAQSATAASHTVKKEFAGEADNTYVDFSPARENAQEARDSGDDTAQAAQGPVADSWESAEAEEIILIEETAAPIKVYNFPMKPWITINLQEIDEARPVFREEAILDIARLKKDFDQVDRNLVSASETYMAYGMSKAGGLRVIRQEDGKDAKLFTDTKDRIFNVAISSSPTHHHHPKEAIIGTGVSGTVYWVQLKNGDRDHLEDAHPEQYGFALPPISAQEGGDAPGGVLKTRARPSSMHPDFFAVGRGKSINLIWPSFIFENNLFKDSHDRVVDTEKMLKQCSLKINTGKAGKDFIFSHDDTLVVSLDKSGRVKFWDVRDLTAVRQGSDPLNPMPARTSHEIKEPLMTLTTTPEGEKAWPTSVLLLDKFLPYQKGAALRYMIVGMKQNHTLQLWDLALGKPVQEFNFPHNKESDAVCSVMYHAQSSMIIVGHPTRNSIYFLHLSAPKYTLKNMSQVDYIQRLVAQDPSIPQPESTAAIGGIREYSFANKGVLRSLNILENPAAAADGDEPTLFELYAMHSKGVTCLFIKHSELGWTKDNKVIAPADAVEAGLAKISKLNPPPAQAAETPSNAHASGDGSATPQIRIATRGAKDAALKIPSPQGDDKRGPEPTTLLRLERKDAVETPVPAPEKTEKNRRKKRAAAAAAAAAGNSADRGDHLPSTDVTRANSQSKANKVARNTDTAAELSFGTTTISQEQLDAVVAKMESRIVSNVTSRFDAVFKDIMEQMQKFQDSRDSAFASNQSTLLQMVADVLNENTEAVLKNLIIAQINSSVIPSVRSAIDKSVSEQLSAKSSAQTNALQKEIQRLLPNAVSQAMLKPEVMKPVSDKLSHSVNAQIEAQITRSLNALTPALAKTTTQTVHQRIVEDVNSRIAEAFAQLEERRRSEDAKLDRLIAQTENLTNAISSLAASQSQVQKELAALKQQVNEQARDRASVAEEQVRGHAHSYSGTGSHGQPGSASRELVNYPPPQHHQHQHQHQHQHNQHQAPAALPQAAQASYPHQPQHQFGHQEGQVVFAPIKSREERQKLELDSLIETIDGLMRSHNYDEAMLRWLQSGDKAEEIFQQVLSNYNPIFVQELQPLLLLSVGATVSVDLGRNSQKLPKKVNLLEVVIYAFNENLGNLDDQVREVTPKIMTLLKTRIEGLFLEISRIAPHDPALKTLSSMSQIAGRIAESVQMRHGPMHAPGHMGAPY